MTASLTRRSALAVGVATATAACGGRAAEAPGAAGAGAAPAPASPSEARPSRPRRSRSTTPRHLTIPRLGVSTSLALLGLNEDRTVEVPTVRGQAGWFRLGTVPGQRGSAVILGHVDSVEGPDVFAELSTMRTEDRVQVRLSDDTLVAFEVTGIATYANADFPADRVYAGTTRARELNLVTCGGVYDPDRGGYQSNVVVYTRRT